MADREVLREFLMSLGFSVDMPSRNKFLGAIEDTTSVAKLAGQAVIALAVAGEALVTSWAVNMEKMYYSGRRTKNTVSDLQAISYAAEQVGLSAEGIGSAMESMQANIRMNPGLRALLNSLSGKDVSKSSGVQQMMSLVQSLSKMPHYQASQFASLFGMDEQTFLMMKDGAPELMKKMADRQAMLKKAGLSEKDAEVWKTYMNSLRDIGGYLEVISLKFAYGLLPYFQRFNDLTVKTLDFILQLSNSVDGFDISSFTDQFSEGIDALKDTIKYLLEIDGKYHILRNTILGIGTAVKFIFDVALAAVKTGMGALNMLLSALAGDKAGFMKSTRQTEAAISSGFSAITNLLTGQSTPETANKLAMAIDRFHENAGRDSSSPIGIRQNNPGNLRSWGNAERQGGFAKFNSMKEGLDAMAGQLLLYGRRNWDSVSSIISHYAPSSENNTAAYIKQVATALGVDENQRLNMRDPETLAKLMGAMIKQEQGYVPVGAADLMAAARGRIGGGGMNQTNNITVNGSSDPKMAAREVGKELDRSNADLTRNLASRAS